jgi:hypothetical protein
MIGLLWTGTKDVAKQCLRHRTESIGPAKLSPFRTDRPIMTALLSGLDTSNVR